MNYSLFCQVVPAVVDHVVESDGLTPELTRGKMSEGCQDMVMLGRQAFLLPKFFTFCVVPKFL